MPKFSEIKQFTKRPCYAVDFPLSSIKRTIADYTEDYKLDMNPDFQRGHVWNQNQQEQFMEFVLRGGESAKNIYFNCPDWNRGAREEFVLVDGLQRLTACLDFLDNKVKVFGHYYQDYEDKLYIGMAMFRFNVNDLKTKTEVLNWYLEMNTGGVVHTDEEIEKVQAMLLQEQCIEEERNR